jgi:hypothetical protein
MPTNIFVTTSLALFLCAGPIAAQDGSSTPASGFAPQLRPSITVRPAAGNIEIDGRLGDPGWAGAAEASGFAETWPDELAEPPVGTEVLVTYDQERLYLAFVAADDPATVRASLRDRDQVWDDDYVCLFLDTYADATWAYTVCANPRGVQLDTRIAPFGEDDGFDIVYQSEASMTESGYVVEMAIPFKSLRFPRAANQTWRATFWRTRPREARATYSWAAIDRDDPCFLCQFGTLTGIEGVEPGGSLELLPAAVASRSSELGDAEDPEAGLGGGDFDADASLTTRYAHPSGLTAEAAINPDFSQVESDVAQIDVNSTFALFFPERRPFFQEGSDLFDSYFTAVYTRQINNPLAATKLVWRRGRTSVAYLGAYDETSPILLPFEERSFLDVADESVSNVLRLRQTYGSNSYAGAILTDRRLQGSGSGSLAGVDGAHRIGDHYQFEYQLLGTRSVEPDEAGLTADLGDLTFDDGAHTAVFDGESFSGYGQYTSFERTARFWSFDVDYWSASPTFRADNGFETRNDFHQVIAFTEWNWYPASGLLDRFTADTRVSRRTTWDGDSREVFVNPTLELTLKGQSFVEFGPSWTNETFRGVEFDGMHRWFVFGRTTPIEELTAGAVLSFGDAIARNLEVPVLAREMSLELFGTIRPVDRVSIEPSFNYARLEDEETGEEIFSGYILRTRTNLNFSRRLFMRLVLQYNDFADQFNAEPLVTYRINPFTLVYVGSTQVWEDFAEQEVFAQTSRQYFAKVQYLFQP